MGSARHCDVGPPLWCVTLCYFHWRTNITRANPLADHALSRCLTMSARECMTEARFRRADLSYCSDRSVFHWHCEYCIQYTLLLNAVTMRRCRALLLLLNTPVSSDLESKKHGSGMTPFQKKTWSSATLSHAVTSRYGHHSPSKLAASPTHHACSSRLCSNFDAATFT